MRKSIRLTTKIFFLYEITLIRLLNIILHVKLFYSTIVRRDLYQRGMRNY